MQTSADMIALLQSAIAAEGSVRAFALKHGLSAAYLSLVVKGVHPISEAIAAALGYRRDFCFYPLQTPNTTEETASND